MSICQNSKKRQYLAITAQFSGFLQLAAACISLVHWLQGGVRGSGQLPVFQVKSAAKNGKASWKTLSWHVVGARFWRKAMKSGQFSREDQTLSVKAHPLRADSASRWERKSLVVLIVLSIWTEMYCYWQRSYTPGWDVSICF